MSEHSLMILQSDPGWLSSRVGYATASHINDILDIRKDGKPGAKYAQYLADIVMERATGRAAERVVTSWMRRGTAMESGARNAYENETGRIVAPAAFIAHPTIEYAGATPDGFLGADGLLEIKVPAPSTYVKWRMEGVVPEGHVGQMCFQLACARRKWVDFCAWNPDDLHPVRQLFIRRFEPEPEEIAALESTVKEFLQVVDKAFEAYCATEPG